MKLEKYYAAAVCLVCCVACGVHTSDCEDAATVTLETLLDEMTSRDAVTRFPSVRYTQRQASSYDRRSSAPDKAGWFANDDGAGYERLDTVCGRVEKVLFDSKGPGAVTRIWLTTKEKFGTMRFYLDGSAEPQIVVPAYDMRRFPVDVPEGLSLTHTHYVDAMDGVGGNTFFLPIPYAESCRITFEEPDITVKIPRYYQINYRTYPAGTSVRTFTLAQARSAVGHMRRASDELLTPTDFTAGKTVSREAELDKGESLVVRTEGEGAVRHMEIAVTGIAPADFGAAAEALAVKGRFDGIECIDAPLSDFAGGGFGAPEIHGWYLDCDGRTTVKSRWVMPYRRNGEIEVVNNGDRCVSVSVKIVAGDYVWDANSLYFRCNHHSETGVPLKCDYSSADNLDWNFITVAGRGVYCGDMLSLYNHAADWYGEGDEKIWVDDDTFPSHFGTGTEDYFNCSWAPVIVFLTPYGGAPRADEESSHGYNAFMRTRNLDIIPFCSRLCFDLEMLSWHDGTADLRATSWWYGDETAEVITEKR
ncbi:MAG: DUF2961 domain-containing protein [Alistipes sp.]|nr:DUF2961 domain-containing protein [Alistipes sp.]